MFVAYLVILQIAVIGIVFCLMLYTFNGLRKVLNENPQIVISKWQVAFNIITVCFMLLIYIFDSVDSIWWIFGFDLYKNHPKLQAILSLALFILNTVMTLLFQMNILVFCWRLVGVSKTTSDQEESTDEINVEITQEIEPAVYSLNADKVLDEDAKEDDQNVNPIT